MMKTVITDMGNVLKENINENFRKFVYVEKKGVLHK